MVNIATRSTGCGSRRLLAWLTKPKARKEQVKMERWYKE